MHLHTSSSVVHSHGGAPGAHSAAQALAVLTDRGRPAPAVSSRALLTALARQAALLTQADVATTGFRHDSLTPVNRGHAARGRSAAPAHSLPARSHGLRPTCTAGPPAAARCPSRAPLAEPPRSRRGIDERNERVALAPPRAIGRSASRGELGELRPRAPAGSCDSLTRNPHNLMQQSHSQIVTLHSSVISFEDRWIVQSFAQLDRSPR